MKYNAVLFDMDGVILDSEPLHISAFRTTLKQRGHNLSDYDYKEYFAGKTDEAGFEAYFKSLNISINIPQIMAEKAKTYLALASDQLTPYSGIITIIKRLSDQIPLALVTGSLLEEAHATLGAFEIADCFSVVISAEDIARSKPSPEGYLKAASILGIEASKCVIVEDAPSGVMAAKNAGITCIAVTNTHSKKELAGADIVVDSIAYELFV